MLKSVTDVQIRAARGLLAWTVGDLAARSGVAHDTVDRLETGASPGDPQSCDILVRVFEAAGVIFLDNCCIAEGGPGVRLKRQGPCDEGLRSDQLSSENDQ